MTRHEAAEPQDTGTSRVLANGLDLLSLVAQTNGELSLREIGRQLGLSPTVTHRLVATLHKRNYLQKNPATGRYVIGVECFRVGRAYTMATGIEGVSKPILQGAAARCGVNCFLGIRKEANLIYLYDFSGTRRSSVRIAAGTEVPLGVTAMGIAILARLGDAEVEAYFERAAATDRAAFERMSPSLRESIAFARDKGFALLNSEIFPGVTSVGAAIVPETSDVAAAVSFGFPTDEVAPERINALGREVRDTARRIELALAGGRLDT
ncbi:MAG: IclR family transcriptional regulator [Rhodobacteraceae bacterium]|nr:IclR family transcriptional regulator [Paracoccaceae bacterium]